MELDPLPELAPASPFCNFLLMLSARFGCGGAVDDDPAVLTPCPALCVAADPALPPAALAPLPVPAPDAAPPRAPTPAAKPAPPAHTVPSTAPPVRTNAVAVAPTSPEISRLAMNGISSTINA